MATINLLPWREELRAERKKEFIAGLALMALVAIFILFVTDLMFDGRISFQEKRNAYVRSPPPPPPPLLFCCCRRCCRVVVVVIVVVAVAVVVVVEGG